MTDTGPPGGDTVVLLHGFPEDRHCWAGVAEVLASAGYRCVAPDLRGDTPACGPAGVAAYRLESSVADALAVADAAGAGRFHVVGHDLGALVAWAAAARHPDRVASVAGVSVPHPAAMAAALRHPDQARRSWYVAAFSVPGAEHLLAAGSRAGAAVLHASGLADPEAAGRYARSLSEPAAARRRLAWYRALPGSGMSALPPVTVPSLFVHGRRDPFVGRRAAGLHRRWAPEGRQVDLDAGHWLPEDRAEAVAEAVLSLLDA